MHKKHLYTTAIILSLTGLSASLVHASSIDKEQCENIAHTIKTQDIEFNLSLLEDQRKDVQAYNKLLQSYDEAVSILNALDNQLRLPRFENNPGLLQKKQSVLNELAEFKGQLGIEQALTERQELLERIENAHQKLTACTQETTPSADKGKEKVYDIEDNLPLSVMNRDTMGTLAELPDELLVKILSFKGTSEAARGLCPYMEGLCFDPAAAGLRITLNNSPDFDTIFNNQTRTIPNSYTHIKLTFRSTNFQLGLIAKLPGLKTLDLSNTTKVSDLSSLAELTTLQELNLNCPRVHDLKPLAGLTALQKLNLSRAKVSDISLLEGLTALQELNLCLTKVRDLKPLAGLTALQKLDLSKIKVSDISPLQGLTALQELNLVGTWVRDVSPLAGLIALQDLSLRETAVNDIDPLNELTALQSLNLCKTRVNNATPLNGLTALQELDLSHTQVSDVGPLRKLFALQRLYLNRTAVSNIDSLNELTALQNLDLRGTVVNDIGPLNELTALQNLDLNDTTVSDIGPLKNLTALQTLHLRNTAVSDIGALAGYTSLTIHR